MWLQAGGRVPIKHTYQMIGYIKESKDLCWVNVQEMKRSDGRTVCCVVFSTLCNVAVPNLVQNGRPSGQCWYCCCTVLSNYQHDQWSKMQSLSMICDHLLLTFVSWSPELWEWVVCIVFTPTLLHKCIFRPLRVILVLYCSFSCHSWDWARAFEKKPCCYCCLVLRHTMYSH